jgi:microsomal dipeptidase-like Zn-dependent dipeptidase
MKTNKNTHLDNLEEWEKDGVIAAELRWFGEDEEADEIEERWRERGYEINTHYIP